MSCLRSHGILEHTQEWKSSLLTSNQELFLIQTAWPLLGTWTNFNCVGALACLTLSKSIKIHQKFYTLQNTWNELKFWWTKINIIFQLCKLIYISDIFYNVVAKFRIVSGAKQQTPINRSWQKHHFWYLQTSKI